MEELPTSHCYLTYDEVITKAQLIQPHFSADLAHFSAFDSWYTSDIDTQLVSGIQTGMKDFPENSLIEAINRIQDLLALKLAAARHCYEKLTYYVGTGFRDTAVTNETFGSSAFLEARSSAKKMIPLLKKAREAISKEGNHDRLLAVGMPEGLPQEMANIAAELDLVYGELKILKKQHLLITRERIELFNSLWDTLSKICDDAKIIFANDPARLAIYELYDTEDSNQDQVEELKIN